jgi:hypothetical protein
MKSVGLSDDEIQSVWKVPAGVLSLLNVNFRREGEGCDIDPSTNRYVEHAAKPWAITEATLRDEFVTTTITLSGDNKITKQYNVTGANDTRDALCKAAYDDIFDVGARTMTIPVPPLVADVNEGTITVLNVVAFGMIVVTASMSIVRLSATPVSELFLLSVAGHTSCSRTRFDGLRK